MGAKSSHGITIRYSTDGISYNVVPYIGDIKIPVAKSDTNEANDHSTIYKQKIAGMIDGGEFSTTVHYDPTNSYHVALRGLVGTLVYIKVLAPAAIVTNNQLAFSGILTQFGPEDGKLGGVLDGPFSVEMSGAPVWSTV